MESGSYAVLDMDRTTVTLFKNFKQKAAFTSPADVRTMFGGPLLSVVTADAVLFYDWAHAESGPVRKIETTAKNILWNDTQELCALSSDGSFFVLRYNADVVAEALASGAERDEDGVEDAFELVEEVEERVRAGAWIGDCFLFTNKNSRVNYFIGGSVYTLAVLERPLHLLGYVPKENRVFLIDKDRVVVSYTLHLSVIEFQTAIVRGDVEGAQQVILPKVPQTHLAKIAHFLDEQGQKQLALEVTTDSEHKYTLALQLNQLDVAQELAVEADTATKWKQLGDLALQNCNFDLATECLKKAKDFSGLLLMYSSCNDAEGLRALAEETKELGKHNVAFMAYYLVGDMAECVNVLCMSEKIPEAALFARSFHQEDIEATVMKWKQTVITQGKLADAIASPSENPTMFADLALFAPQPEPEEDVADEADEPTNEPEEAPEAEEPTNEPEPEPELEKEEEEAAAEPEAAPEPVPAEDSDGSLDFDA
eukprot:NODE_688_length_1708_cov_56.311195_g678_i0.p1 GENE.NODE_688_length_1708_cov_56.311195_g678_i0~~NODE_688_length_1708_cov_56.311195_g678_i0.p1  ORF type:complete len:503 (+),score=150.94 NODE_688_length_1708_cov_56.311195_g678_i0:66-1511(+)